MQVHNSTAANDWNFLLGEVVDHDPTMLPPGFENAAGHAGTDAAGAGWLAWIGAKLNDAVASAPGKTSVIPVGGNGVMAGRPLSLGSQFLALEPRYMFDAHIAAELNDLADRRLQGYRI